MAKMDEDSESGSYDGEDWDENSVAGADIVARSTGAARATAPFTQTSRAPTSASFAGASSMEMAANTARLEVAAKGDASHEGRDGQGGRGELT